MKTNPVIDEVRKTRKQISLRHGNDLKKLEAYYQQKERSLACSVRESRVLRRAV